MRQNEYLWSTGLMTLGDKTFENIVRQGENAFSPYPQFFQPYDIKQHRLLSSFKWSTTNVFSLLFGKELKQSILQ